MANNNGSLVRTISIILGILAILGSFTLWLGKTSWQSMANASDIAEACEDQKGVITYQTQIREKMAVMSSDIEYIKKGQAEMKSDIKEVLRKLQN